MSHLTTLKTSLSNLFYLEMTLSRLKITYDKKLIEQNLDNILNLNLCTRDGVQLSTKDDAKFSWNGTSYNLVADPMFWRPTYSLQAFITEISQHYAGEILIRESQKIGLQPVDYLENSDGSNTLVVEQYQNTLVNNIKN